MLKKGSSSLC